MGRCSQGVRSGSDGRVVTRVGELDAGRPCSCVTALRRTPRLNRVPDAKHPSLEWRIHPRNPPSFVKGTSVGVVFQEVSGLGLLRRRR